VNLPSASTGTADGTLALRVDAPPPGHELLSRGAPVAIVLPGGFGAGSLRALAPGLLKGVVVISFLFPGGCDAGRCSDGLYDYRGAASVAAAADVVRFAMGLRFDRDGRSIDSVTGLTVLHNGVGFVALSNGGAMAMAVLAEYGMELDGVRWLVGWENPSNAQTVAMDPGPGANVFCPGPPPGRRTAFANPWYTYEEPVLHIDSSTIAYDPVLDKVFLDGNRNGRFDLRERGDGCLDPDLNGDGAIGLDEDFGLRSAYDGAGSTRHFSPQTVQALWDRGVFASQPYWLDSPEGSAEFWRLREETKMMGAAAVARPDLKTILLASEKDHVQAQPDHPHIRLAFDGLTRHGMWVKLNPSPETVLEVMPDLPDLIFTPDPGIRVDHASNPAPALAEDGTTYLFFSDRSVSPPRLLVAASSDGLTFGIGQEPRSWEHDPRRVLLPDGTWRRYLAEQEVFGDPGAEMVFRSESSSDGAHFTRDSGIRYRPPQEDRGAIGVYDVFVDREGGTVLLYIGDMGGPTASVRRAYSLPGDNGWTFAFESDVLGGYGAGQGHNHVDPKSLPLPDGRRRLFAMFQGPLPPQPGVRAVGRISSFVTTDGGRSFEKEGGWRLQPEDFTGLPVWSLNDPWVVQLRDGRYRMYVAALVGDSPATTRWAILSATTGARQLPDLPAGTAPTDWTSVGWTYPETVPDEVMQAAAVLELARAVEDATAPTPQRQASRRSQ